MSHFQIVDNYSNPFKIVLLSSLSTNENIELKLTYTDSGYSGFDYITIKVNDDYLNISPNLISTTLTGNGAIGFNADYATEGVGAKFKDLDLTYASSFLVGNSSTQVSDHMYGATLDWVTPYDNDFSNVQTIKQVNPASYSEADYTTTFNDDGNASKLGLEIKQNTYGWSETGYDKFIIMEYEITNSSGSTLSNLYAGIFNDWEMNGYWASSIYYVYNAALNDTANRLGYAKSLLTNLYAGVHLINTDEPFNSYAMDMDMWNGSIGWYYDGGFTDAEKYTMLSTSRDSAGFTGYTYGEDIGGIVSAGPFTLAAGATKKIAFALNLRSG